jgi:YggT family protein
VCGTCLLDLYAEAFINVLSSALTLVIFGRVLLSWVPARLPWGLNDFIYSVTEPILSPIRRALPLAAGLDLSPLVALVLIQLLTSVLLRLLPPVI